MTLRLLSAIVALCLSAAPVLGALCGLDCGRAQSEAVQSEVVRDDSGHDHLHAARAQAGAAGAAEAIPPDTAPAEAPHDCHRSGGPGDIPALGAGSASCTHVRFESAPAQIVAVSDSPLHLPAVLQFVDFESFDLKVERWRVTSVFFHRLAVVPTLDLPLRI